MAQCQVTVTVTDENDHAPVISITNVASTSVDNGKRARYTRDVTISGEFGPKINTHAAHTGVPFFNTAQKCTLLSVRLYYDLD